MTSIPQSGNWFARLLTKIIPGKTKRLILLASLTAWLSNKTKFDKNTFHKLNTVMQLCRTDEALEFPMLINKVIWKGNSGNVVLYPEHNSNDLEKAVTRLLNQVPCWLRYSDNQEMKNDISKLLENRMLLT